MSRQTLERALTLPGGDFEVACAILAGLDALVTRDETGFSAVPLPVFTPADLLAQLPPPSPS